MFCFYHNPRCSKSREALALLTERGIAPEIIRYLETPPDTAALRVLIDKLGITPRALLRTGETEYKTLNLANPALTDEAIIAAMAAHPKLIERPILIAEHQAVIGRPPGQVLSLL